MDHLTDLDPQFTTVMLGLFMFGFIIGRYTKATRSVENYSKALSVLNKKIETACGRKLKYKSYSETIATYGKLSLVLSGLVMSCQMYFGIVFFLDNFIIASSITSLITILYSLSYACTLISKDYSYKEEMYKQQITSSKSDIIKDLGPEVIEILQGTECNKKCKENVERIEKNLKRHQELIQKFAKFQWCDACSQRKKCTGMCGSEFWVYTTDALKEFRTG